MEILTQGFKIVDVMNGNLDLDNIKTIAIANESLRRGWLGVTVQDIDKSLAEALSLNSQRGVIILNDSPEDNAGLKEKDVIILIDNEKVYDMLQFKHLMSKAYANDIKEFTIIRSGKEMNVTATINALPVEDQNIDYEQIFISYEDSLNGFFIPKEMTLLFKVKVLPIDDSFCFTGLTINEHDTSNIKLGECKTGLLAQELVLTDTSEVKILTGEYATETGTILQETDEGKYDILLEDSTIVKGIDPNQVNRLEEQVYSGNYLYIKNVDYRKKMIDIYYQTDNVIAGFQFEVSGIKITGASGGNAEEAGFMISSSSTTVLGFSLTGSTFDGKGKLIQIEYFADKTARDNDAAVAPLDCASAVASFGCDYNWGGTSISNSCPESCSFLGLSTICIESIVVSDPTGEAIDTHSGECWIP